MGETKLRFSGDEKDLEKSYRKAFDQQEKLIRKVQSANERLRGEASRNKKQFEDTNEAAFGSPALARISSYVAGVASIGTAVSLARQAWAQLNAEVDRGVNAIREIEQPYSRLAQLATKQRPMTTMVGEARRSIAAGLPSEEAGALQFNLESAGFPQERAMFAKLYPTMAPSAMAAQINMSRGALGSSSPSPGSMLNMMIAAASKSPLDAEAFAPLVSSVAPLGREIGASPTELLASLGSMAKSAGGGPEAATQLNALMKTIAAKGMAGQGLEAGASAVSTATAGMDPAAKLKYFGRIEGLKGLSAFQAQASLRRNITGLVGGAAAMEPGAMAEEFVRSRRSVPELALGELMRASEGTSMLDLVEAPGVSAEAQIQAYKQITRAGLHKQGKWADRGSTEYNRWLTSFILPKGENNWYADLMGGSEVGMWRRSAQRATEGMSSEDMSDLLEHVLRRATGEGVRDGLRGNTLSPQAERGDRTENDF